MKHTFAAALVALSAAAIASAADIRITEWMYQGGNGEFVELTNVGNSAVDMTGWSYDDDSEVPGTVSLSAFGVLQPGKSAVFTETDAATFIAAWNLVNVPVIGGVTTNLGRNDEINIFDAGDQLADRLTFGDQNIPGTIRTQNKSGNPNSVAALGANDVRLWSLAAVGDVYGSYTSTGGDIGNPGTSIFVPEPATLSVLALFGLIAARRRA